MLNRDLRCAIDPVTFATEALGFAPDPWQVRVLRSEAQRLLLNCGRQVGKSTIAAILALHHAVYHRHALILLLSPSQRQSQELFRKVTGFLQALPEARALVEDTRLSFTLANESRVVGLPSNEETIRGFSGVTLLVEDEAARVPDELYIATRPMLATSGGRHILMSTPAGRVGHFYAAWIDPAETWERVEIPAAECPRISPHFLLEEKQSLGLFTYNQEYGCQFGETVAQVFSDELIERAVAHHVKPFLPNG